MMLTLRGLSRSSSRPSLTLVTLLAAALLGVSCDGGEGAAQHQVFFVGYVYDGATGKRLAAADLTAISLKYRDKVVRTKIDTDGRFVTIDALPTWQDYSVYVGAEGYRPFVSNNPGIDVPKAVQMTDGVGTKGTVQTFEFVARLFPLGIEPPKVRITIEKSDALLQTMAPTRAAGTLRLTPVSSSAIEQSLLSGSHAWLNDEDLLTQTITKTFTEGFVEILGAELVYGVNYQIAIFDVDGYQPFPTSSGSQAGLLSAGSVTSLFVSLAPETKAPLKVLGTNADKCMPPAPTATAFGATIDITFSDDIEVATPTFAEDVDNGVSISVGTSTSTPCTLNPPGDPAKQERGTKATIDKRVLTLSFNPSVGLATITTYGTTCTPPTSLAGVTYNLANVYVQPVGDPVRKVSVGTLLGQLASGSTFPSTTSVSCPVRIASSSSF